MIEADGKLISKVLDASFEVHSELGPGLLESVYQNALCVELEERGISYEREVPVNVLYKGRDLGIGFRSDIIVEKTLLLELKSVESLLDIHLSQVLTYLKLLTFKRGLLLNFGSKLLKNGIKRVSI
jgi:GxxExxY protein